MREAVETFDAGGAEREDSAGRGAGVGASFCRVHSEGSEWTSATILKKSFSYYISAGKSLYPDFFQKFYLERTSWIKNRLDELMLVGVDCASGGEGHGERKCVFACVCVLIDAPTRARFLAWP